MVHVYMDIILTALEECWFPHKIQDRVYLHQIGTKDQINYLFFKFS